MNVPMPVRLLMAAVAIIGATMSASPPTLAQEREPTEVEMRAAVEQWFQDVHAQYREMAQACTGPVQSRTLPPDICARICSSPTNCLAPFEVSNFRKDNCRPSGAEGQIYCTFTVDVVTANPAMKEAGAPSQGLFTAPGGNWRFVRTPPQ